jgi:hypothetical protein
MKKLIMLYKNANVYLKLIPFLVLYIIIVFLFGNKELSGDEPRYLMFANNLLNGFYSPPKPNTYLWNGPGYPLFIAVFSKIGFSVFLIRMLNAFLLYFALVISHKTIIIFSNHKNVFLFTTLLGLYFPLFQMLPAILTECLTWFLISLVCYLLVRTINEINISWKLIILSAFSLSFLTMTKVIFGHVITLMIIVSVVMLFSGYFRLIAKRLLLIFLISLLFCSPWLLYTYNLTGKPFYWTDSGGMSLYTISSPYDNEYGDWMSDVQLKSNDNHKLFMESISSLNSLERDEAYKAAAIENIKKYPKKFISNWVANLGRLFFSYPFSYENQKISTYFHLFPNMILIIFIFLTTPVSIKHYKKFPKIFIPLFLFFTIYLFGSSIVSAYSRMFYVTLPFWFLFLTYFFTQIISLRIKEV